MTTYSTFDFSNPIGRFSVQLNSLINGGSTGCGTRCAYAWWIQGYVDLVDQYLSNPGAWVVQSQIEAWNGSYGPQFCTLSVLPGNAININSSGMGIQEEYFLTASSQVKNALTVFKGGTVYYSNSMTCSYPSGIGSVNYINQVEGVIVGYDTSYPHASFAPLQSEIFSGYIDFVSNYNKFYYALTTTQTGETLNLYQNPTSEFGTSYGSMYLYTVKSTENTETST